jgi:DNA-binding CsgD family transcriptional regulator
MRVLPCAARCRSPRAEGIAPEPFQDPLRGAEGLRPSGAATSLAKRGNDQCLRLLPEAAAILLAEPVRLAFCQFPAPGPDFSEQDRAVLTLLGPHLDRAHLDAERRRHPVPRLTPRQTGLLRLEAAGHTNTQIARRLGVSEGTVRTRPENIYKRLQVSSHTAAVPAPSRIVSARRV